MIREIFDGCGLRALKVLGDERGQLVVLEGEPDVPFTIARVYYIFGTQQGVARGFHAHRELDQIAICISGSCTMLVDDGFRREELRLDRPDHALSLGPMIWHEMRDFTPDCVLLLLASAMYDEGDYIRDYDQFLALAKHEPAR